MAAAKWPTYYSRPTRSPDGYVVTKRRIPAGDGYGLTRRAIREGAMVPWWKRLVYSLVSVIAAVVLCFAAVFAEMFLRNSSGHPLAGDFLIAVAMTILACIPGWLIAVPVVLIANDIQGWRFWLLWVVGSCIGPLLLLVFAMLAFQGSAGVSTSVPDIMDFVYLGAAVSCLSTTVYLLLLRWSQRAMAKNRSSLQPEKMPTA